MTRIIVNAELAEQLRQAKAPVELIDANGQFLGLMQPQVDGYLQVEPPISQEELDERARSDRWYTTEQVLQRLYCIPHPSTQV